MFDDYFKALDMLVKAEDTSTLEDSNVVLNSTVALIAARKSRQKRHRKKFSDESSDMDNDEDEEERLRNVCKKAKSANKKLPIEIMMGKPPHVASLSSANDISIPSIPPQHFSTPSSNTTCDLNVGRRPPSPPKEAVVTNGNGFQELMLRKMNAIISKLTNIDKRIDQLESQYRLRTLTEDTNDVDEEIDLPIKTMQELEEFEDKLKNNTKPVNSTCVFVHQYADTVAKTANANNDISWSTIIINTQVPIKVLILIVSMKKAGGNTVNAASAAVLEKLLDDSVAEQFSWDGKKHKKEFKTLLTAKLFKRAVHSMCHPACTDLQIKNVASQWLAQAKTRRQRREKRSNEREQTPNISRILLPHGSNIACNIATILQNVAAILHEGGHRHIAATLQQYYLQYCNLAVKYCRNVAAIYRAVWASSRTKKTNDLHCVRILKVKLITLKQL
ncbi:hypothetical protein PV328_011143 [Microctonus aethiopoides]|uniref:DUF4806 domain-containing protein n=1 Tax=Microctonus aethiopoides TaxID=144406 RepID=A0AA39C3Y3_9HYME|nr:hypothetical protein PV328_011143 [Microctonus aethiopoides]